MARTTISLPDELKARMDAASEPVNWSQIASLAFEKKLGEIATRKRNEDMDDVIQRLRASRIDCQDAEEKDGYETGKRWARRSAKWTELENLESALEDDRFWYCLPNHLGWAGIVLGAMKPRGIEDMNSSEVSSWWSELGSDDPSELWLHGFCDGAMEVFDAVKDKV